MIDPPDREKEDDRDWAIYTAIRNAIIRSYGEYPKRAVDGYVSIIEDSLHIEVNVRESAHKALALTDVWTGTEPPKSDVDLESKSATAAAVKTVSITIGPYTSDWFIEPGDNFPTTPDAWIEFFIIGDTRTFIIQNRAVEPRPGMPDTTIARIWNALQQIPIPAACWRNTDKHPHVDDYASLKNRLNFLVMGLPEA